MLAQVPIGSSRVRSVLVGVGASVADFALLAALVEMGRVRPELAVVPAMLLGLMIQFVGNKYFAFGDRSVVSVGQAAAFLGVEVGTLLLGAGCFALLVSWQLPYGIARLLAAALVYFGFSFPLWRCVFGGVAQTRRLS